MKILNNIVSVFVILIIGFIIIPLPPWLLDAMFLLNISLSIMILLITMYQQDSLDFSVFPSLLLITTLFRLSLNISSTRLILTKEGHAGQVIQTFGNFVLGGNVVVGTLLFIIIVIVNFLVITKGAERVSEVSARFKLDAMPGKQMAIDADLNAGLIDEQTARTRRTHIQREAEFYGSMDGATKFVKGDAIMSIIITFINFVAGVIIGMVQGGGSFSDVLKVYSIATVGDGLVSQLPALLISTATGMIVTRSASDSSLSLDVTRQFLARPVVMFIAGGAMLALCLIPGMPLPQLLVLAAALFAAGYVISRRQKEETALAGETAGGGAGAPAAEETDEAAYYRDVDHIYDLLPVDPVEMEFGYSLIPMVDERHGGSFIERLINFRRQYAMEMGFVIPAVRLHDDGMLLPNQYLVKIRGEEVARGEVLVDHYLALDGDNLTGEVDGIETIEPAYGIPSRWITPEKKEIAEIYGYTVIDPLSVIVAHLSEIIKAHAWEMLSRQEVSRMMDTVRKSGSTLPDDVVPSAVPLSTLQKVLAGLLKEEIPIRDMETILETVADHAASVRETDHLTEYVRQALKRTITRKWSEGGQIRVITLDGEVERQIVNSISKNDQGTFLALDPQTTQKLITRLLEAFGKVHAVMPRPVVLTSPLVRIYFSRLLEQFASRAVVLSYNELDNDVQIQALANITLD